MMRKYIALVGVAACFLMPQVARAGDDVKEFVALRDAYVAKYKPLYIESSAAWWEANTTGKDEAFSRKKKSEEALVELRSDAATFAKIKALMKGGKIIDPVMARELQVMYREFLPGQADKVLQKKIVNLENEVTQMFNTHRSKVDGKDLTENDVRTVLTDSKDSAAAEKAWKGYMEVGKKVEANLKQLVAWRNEMAKSLGFKNFYVMRMTLDEIGEEQLLQLFDELDTLTREPYAEVKRQIDADRAARFGVKVTELRPWHFGDLFFQEAPAGADEGVNLDEIYKSQDLLAMTKNYYSSIGMETADIIARSDLYEKPGKSPHAFSTCINRGDDVRVLCNLKQNLYWADTIMHEMGHAVYDKYTDDVPFLLHEPAHSLTTEGYAIMMGSLVKNEEFLAKVVKLPPAEAAKAATVARQHLRREKLIFSRWAQVMVRFEHGMYTNPDQDLGKLWWDVKKKYQLMNPPEDTCRPDYGAKIHVVTNAAYYHSYMMGDLFACQIQDKIAQSVLGVKDPTKTCFYGEKKAGDFMKKYIFGPGDMYMWNDLTKRATGEPLSAKYFAKQYVAK